MRLVLLASLLLVAPAAMAQWTSTAQGTPPGASTDVFGPSTPARPAQRRTLGPVIVAAVAGYGLGAGAGYSVGLATDSDFVAEDILSGNGLLAAGIGGGAGASLGAHLANGRRGSLWLGALASVAAQGLYTYAITREPLDGRRFALVVGVPLVGTATSVAVERLTSR